MGLNSEISMAYFVKCALFPMGGSLAGWGMETQLEVGRGASGMDGILPRRHAGFLFKDPPHVALVGKTAVQGDFRQGAFVGGGDPLFHFPDPNGLKILVGRLGQADVKHPAEMVFTQSGNLGQFGQGDAAGIIGLDVFQHTILYPRCQPGFILLQGTVAHGLDEMAQRGDHGLFNEHGVAGVPRLVHDAMADHRFQCRHLLKGEFRQFHGPGIVIKDPHGQPFQIIVTKIEVDKLLETADPP